MSYPEKRGNTLTGKWYGEIKHKRNGRFRRRFATKDRADAYEAHVKAFGEEPEWACEDDNAEAVGVTFKAVADELKAAGGPKGKWKRGKDKSVLQRLEFITDSKLGRVLIKDWTYATAEELLKLLRDRPGMAKGEKLSPATLNRYLTAASSVLTYAEQKRHIDRSPHLPWQHVPKKRKATYTETQQTAVCRTLEAAGFATEAFLVNVLAVGGLRAGELLGLKPEQIDDDFVVLDDPENIKNEVAHEVWVGRENADRLRVLITSGQMPTYHTFYMHLRDAIKTCGYDIPRPIHALRHTAATRTLDTEEDIQIAQQLLGHRSANTTAGYRHTSREVLRKRAEKRAHARGKTAETTSAPEVIEFKKQA